MGKLTSLSELSSSGKSGSFFYFTEDSSDLNIYLILGKFMIKTISKNEFFLMKKMLKQYFLHIMGN
jgi:1-phosphatidylinositol-4-phosphate 5-kinase